MNGPSNTFYRQAVQTANERANTLKEALRLVLNGTFQGIFIQTEPGLGTIATTRETVGKEMAVLNCFRVDDEFLRDVNNVLFKQPAGGTVIFDIHEPTFEIDFRLVACLERMANQDTKFVFISKHKQDIGAMPNSLGNRTFHLLVSK